MLRAGRLQGSRHLRVGPVLRAERLASRCQRWAAAIACATFAALLVAEIAGALGPRSVDARLEAAAHRAVLDHHGLLTVARWLTNLGAPVVVDVLAVLAAGALWLARRRREAAYVVLVRAAAELSSSAVKELVARDRPTFARPVAHVAGYSFPSGHASGAASVYLPLAVVGCGLLASTWVRRTGATLAVLACLAVAATRVLLGVHYLSDVIAGLALGAALTIVLSPLLRDRESLAVGESDSPSPA